MKKRYVVPVAKVMLVATDERIAADCGGPGVFLHTGDSSCETQPVQVTDVDLCSPSVTVQSS